MPVIIVCLISVFTELRTLVQGGMPGDKSCCPYFLQNNAGGGKLHICSSSTLVITLWCKHYYNKHHGFSLEIS